MNSKTLRCISIILFLSIKTALLGLPLYDSATCPTFPNIPAGTAYESPGGGGVELNADTTISGTLVVLDQFFLGVDAGVELKIADGGVIFFEGDNSLYGPGITYRSRIYNSGTITLENNALIEASSLCTLMPPREGKIPAGAIINGAEFAGDPTIPPFDTFDTNAGTGIIRTTTTLPAPRNSYIKLGTDSLFYNANDPFSGTSEGTLQLNPAGHLVMQDGTIFRNGTTTSKAYLTIDGQFFNYSLSPLNLPSPSTVIVGTTGKIKNPNTINNYGIFTNSSSINEIGTFNNYGTFIDFTSGGVSEIPAGTTVTIPAESALSTDPLGTLNINGTLIVTGTLNANGTVNSNNILNSTGLINASGILNLGGITNISGTINANNPLTITANGVLTLNTKLTVNNPLTVNGIIKNLSISSIDVNDTMYVYNTVENGDISNPGTINVNYGGSLFTLGGAVKNKHASSAINVQTGGAMYNYLGVLDTNLGTLLVKKGAQLTNARGGYPANVTLNNGAYFTDGTKVTLDKDLDLDYTWTITFKTTINGAGYNINLGPTGGIVIKGSTASVMFEDVLINDVSGNKIRCTDNTSTMTLSNVSWYQDSNFSFTKGKIYVDGQWNIFGDGTTFSYESDQISTVTDNSSINVQLATFRYNTSSPSRLYMENSSSVIYLDRATLLASQNCTLARGSLTTNGYSTLQGDAQLILTGLSNKKFIDGVHTTGNVTLY